MSTRKGVFYGWFILAAVFFVLFMSTGVRNSFGVFVIPLSNDFEWSRSTVSLAIAVGWLVNGVTQPFVGRLYDRFGARKVITISLVVLGVSTMLLSQTNSIWFLVVVYGLVMSVAGGGTSLVTVHALLARWFFRRRGVALSIGTSGGGVGALVLAPFAAYMILLAGWRTTWMVLGAMKLVLAVPLAAMLIKNAPSDIGELPDGRSASPERGGRDQGQTQDAPRGPLEAETWHQSYRSRPMWQMTGAYFVCGMTTAIISFHYVPFAIDRGVSLGMAALAFGVMNALNVVGVLAVGFISDKLGRKNLLASVYAVRGIGYIILVLVPGALGLWGFAIIAGLAWVATAPLTASLTADIYGVKNLGTLNGVATFAHQMGGALSIYLGGLLYDVFGAYDVPFAIAGSLLVGASLAALTIKERKYSARYQPQAGPATASHPG